MKQPARRSSIADWALAALSWSGRSVRLSLLGRQHRLAAWLVAASLVTGACDAAEPAAELLCDQVPYDEIELTAESGGAVLKVEPFDFESNRQLEPDDEIEIRLLGRPEARYRLARQHIARVTSFAERVLAEARQLANEQRYAEAERDFRFLSSHAAGLAELPAALEDFAWRRAQDALVGASPERSLVLLQEVWRISPQKPGLSQAYRQATDLLVERWAREEKWRAVRRLVEQFRSRFPREERDAVSHWAKLLASAAEQHMEAARQALAASDVVAAAEQLRVALQCRPNLAPPKTLLAQVLAEHPVVWVGVQQLGQDPLDWWSERRHDTLLARRLVRPSLDDGELHSPFGQLSTSDKGRRVEFLADPSSGDAAADGSALLAELATRLGAAATGGTPAFCPDWADSLVSLGMPASNRLVVEFRRPPLHLAAWLRLPALGPNVGERAADTRQSLGSYRAGAQTDGKVIYRYAGRAARGAQPEQIVERSYAGGEAMLQALAANQIDLAERVGPWELPRWGTTPGISMIPYRQPTLHLLVIKTNEPRVKERDLCRGLSCAIDRDAILRSDLLAGRPVAGCTTIDSPFGDSAGRSSGARAGASAPRLAKYNPELGRALLQQALRSSQAPGSRQSRPLRIGLAATAGEAARRGAAAIVRQLVALDVAAEIVSEPASAATQADFEFVEFVFDEPTVDVQALVNRGGLWLKPSAEAERLLRQIAEATSLDDARVGLDDLAGELRSVGAVVPLWQIVEYVAVHSSLSGVGERPGTLYERIQDWRIAGRPEEIAP